MNAIGRWFWVGSRPEVESALRRAIGSAPAAANAAAADGGDLVVIDARAGREVLDELPTGHVFGAVREWKRRRGLRVLVVVDGDDRTGAQLARFCLADGVLPFDRASGALDLSELQQERGARARPSVDALLQRLEADVAASGGGESTVQRLLRFERDVSLLTRLQDPETGLLDGPYATLKLDEEWKRAQRFHQPLSLLLIDVGKELADAGPADRSAALAEIAGVFLNECRDIDVLARFAPTVFLFLLPGTGPDGAGILGRRMLDALRGRRIAGVRLDPKAGMATVPSSEIGDRKTFLMVAEACLRQAHAGAGDGGLCTSWQ